MMKKLMVLGLLAMMLVSPVSGWGETARVEPLMMFKKEIISVGGNGRSFVIVPEKQSGLKAVFATDGTQLSPYLFNNLSFLVYDYLIGYDEKGVNNRALVFSTGEIIVGPAYGNYVCFGKHWIAAYVLVEATSNDYSYKRGNDYFHVEKVDLFYVANPPEGIRFVGSLAPEAFDSASAHGAFLAVKAEDGTVSLYDTDCNILNYPMEKTNSPVYGVVDYTVVNQATGETVTDGVISVKEQTINGDTTLTITRYDFKGTKVSGIIDLNGNILVPVEYSISSVSLDNVLVTKGKLVGLYSIAQQKLIVPCEFDNLMRNSTASNQYVFNGYVAVEKDGFRGYYNTQTGELSCEIKYNTTTVTTVGCTTYWKTENGTYILAAADGVETEVDVDLIYNKVRGDGHLLVAVKDDFYGVIDWHGNTILPFEHKNVIAITDDSKALIRTSTGYELDAVFFDE